MADFDFDKVSEDNDLFDEAGKEILEKLGVDPEGIAGMSKQFKLFIINLNCQVERRDKSYIISNFNRETLMEIFCLDLSYSTGFKFNDMI